jgi:hypothetical protein
MATAKYASTLKQLKNIAVNHPKPEITAVDDITRTL